MLIMIHFNQLNINISFLFFSGILILKSKHSLTQHCDPSRTPELYSSPYSTRLARCIKYCIKKNGVSSIKN